MDGGTVTALEALSRSHYPVVIKYETLNTMWTRWWY